MKNQQLLEMVPINIRMPQERLLRKLRDYGRDAIDLRQIARRLKSLLPRRLRDLRHQAQGNLIGAARDRLILTSPSYRRFIDEYCLMQERARYAQIQFETHRMLYEARRSLRALAACR